LSGRETSATCQPHPTSMLPFFILVTACPKRLMGELFAPWNTCPVGLPDGTTPAGSISGWMTLAQAPLSIAHLTARVSAAMSSSS
jgi:hypothetical protein